MVCLLGVLRTPTAAENGNGLGQVRKWRRLRRPDETNRAADLFSLHS